MAVNEVKKVLFIVNKFSGSGFQPEVEGRIIRSCESQEFEYTIEFTRDRGHATELAREGIAKNFNMIVAVGGDGTINEVAQGVLNTQTPMGIIPKGSGNGLARHLGIPIKIPAALDALFTSVPVSMDTFTVNGKLSMNVSGIGFDGHIANLFGKNKKRGLSGYVRLTVNEFFQFNEFDVDLEVDGSHKHHKAFIMAIANSSQYGNNARIAPMASVRDGLLHVSLLKKVPPYRLDFVYAFFKGKIHESAYCDVFETRSISVKTKKPTAFHVDGEPCGEADRFIIEINPASIQIMAPPTSIHI